MSTEMKALDVDVLTMIVAVADTGTISRAADLVHRSQSAVSMQIKTLELALGKALFVRKPRSVVPTQDGEVLLVYARRIIALRDEAWAAVVRPDVTGRVVIGVPDDYASSLFPPILKKFSATYPKVEIQVIGLPSVALAPMLRDGAVDLVCATRVGYPLSDGSGRQKLLQKGLRRLVQRESFVQPKGQASGRRQVKFGGHDPLWKRSDFGPVPKTWQSCGNIKRLVVTDGDI
ncbi:HTH-type transcriptional regulator HdfR [Ralstonia wenshanensis]|uniref:HTH-type transcriptional regulator HdfR n=1 Tax=Ralstonia wenshanensis TaxID=2842456 RepID=A0AAD2ENU1_9RALS|nr:HTH-type transcriptional regulator HdfR [Ralstonia wenshanensis]